MKEPNAITEKSLRAAVAERDVIDQTLANTATMTMAFLILFRTQFEEEEELGTLKGMLEQCVKHSHDKGVDYLQAHRRWIDSLISKMKPETEHG